MKTAIFNLQIGPLKSHWDICLKTQHAYCKKYGIDHYISKTPFIRYKWCAPHCQMYFEKLQCLYLFDKGYDQVLMLDSDVLISPNAKNIFDKYTDVNKIYAYDENQIVGINDTNLLGGITDIMDRDPYVNEVIINRTEQFNWDKNNKNKYVFYNTGVFIFGKNAVSVFRDKNKFESLANTKNIYCFAEQTYMNSIIQKYDIPNESIDYSFNRMNLGGRDENNERYKADFIHYAGPCLYNTPVPHKFSEEKKVHAIIKDYNFLYG